MFFKSSSAWQKDEVGYNGALLSMVTYPSTLLGAMLLKLWGAIIALSVRFNQFLQLKLLKPDTKN